VAIIISF